MNGARTELDERVRNDDVDRRLFQQQLKHYNIESASQGGNATPEGIARRHLTRKKSDLLYAASDKNFISVYTTAAILNQLSRAFEKAVETAIHLTRHWAHQIIKSKEGMMPVDPLDPRAVALTADVAVPHSVYMKMTQAESLARAEHMAINKIFAGAHCMGPHPEQKPHYETLQHIERTHLMRHDLETGEYSFCMKNLHQLALAAPDADEPASHTLKAFFIVAAPHTSKGLKVGITADGELTQNDLQVIENAAPVISVPPHLKAVLGR